MLSFAFNDKYELTRSQDINVSGNVLDVSSFDEKEGIIVSVDNVHTPGSMVTLREGLESASRTLLQSFTPSAGDSGELNWKESSNDAVSAINSRGILQIAVPDDEKEAQNNFKNLTGYLYKLGNLRKRSNED